MTTTTAIPEKNLLYHLICPLRSDPTLPVPDVLSCAENTARWLMAEQLAGRAPTAKQTRDYFDQTGYFQPREGLSREQYERHTKEGFRACRRLSELIWRCEVLRPVSPYTLAVGDVLIAGEYGVLRSSRRKKHAFALYLRHAGIRIKPLRPDVVSFARWFDLAKRHTEAANRHWGIQSIGVMHYWVTRDLAAEHKTEAAFATDVLCGAAGAFTGNPFPVPGEHCLSCSTLACRPE